VTTAQHIARKTIKNRYLREYQALFTSLKAEYKHELPEFANRAERNRWASRLGQQAIRILCKSHHNEYRIAYNNAKADGWPSLHRKQKKDEG
jgi:hypothetical protein